MNATKAIKAYIGQEPNAGERVSAKELLAFKNSMDEAEYQDLGRQAAEALGESFEARSAT